MKVTSYLYFNGNCEEAFKFYETCLGAKILMMMPHTGSPVENIGPPGWGDKILHASLSVGDTMLYASDAPPDRYSKPGGFSVSPARRNGRRSGTHLPRAFGGGTGTHGTSGDLLGSSLRHVQRSVWDTVDDQLRKTMQ